MTAKPARLKVEYIAPDKLIPNTYNPNRQDDHAFRLLVSSIKEDGFTQPVIIGQDNVIVDGEHRWRAAKEVGLAEIPVVRVDLDDAKRRVATIRHNEARGTHEADLVGQILADLDTWGALDEAMVALDMDRDEVDRLLSLIDATAPAMLGADEPSEAWVPSTVQAGDSEVIGQYTDKGAAASPQATTAVGAGEAERRVVRLTYIVSEEEATVIQQALGNDTPALTLVNVCRQMLATADV